MDIAPIATHRRHTGNRGGNVIALPGNVLVVGQNMDQSVRRSLNVDGSAKIVDVDVGGLPTEHVDML